MGRRVIRAFSDYARPVGGGCHMCPPGDLLHTTHETTRALARTLARALARALADSNGVVIMKAFAALGEGGNESNGGRDAKPDAHDAGCVV